MLFPATSWLQKRVLPRCNQSLTFAQPLHICKMANVMDQGVTTAGAYYDSDFSWQEHAAEVAGQVDLTTLQWRELQAASQDTAQASTSYNASQASPYEAWEDFHAMHSSARFFKERRYITLAFPQLMQENVHVLEIGCGYGSSLLPLLRANPTAEVTGCDVSTTAIQLFLQAVQGVPGAPERARAFPLDGASASARDAQLAGPPAGPTQGPQEGPLGAAEGPGSVEISLDSSNVCSASDSEPARPADATPQHSSALRDIAPQSNGKQHSKRDSNGNTLPVPNDPVPIADIQADLALLVFTLSALQPEDMHNLLKLTYDGLRPGGLLLFRDYGLYDLPHLRFSAASQRGENLYMREDGTLAYFFSVADLTARAQAAGFHVVECKYACTKMQNRKSKTDMKRVFLHAVLQVQGEQNDKKQQ